MLFEYVPQNEDELELKVGDMIDISEEVSCFTELVLSSCGQKWLFYYFFYLFCNILNTRMLENSKGVGIAEGKANSLGVVSLRFLP